MQEKWLSIFHTGLPPANFLNHEAKKSVRKMSARGDKKALTYIPSSECNLSGQLVFYKRFPGVKPAGNCVILI